MFTLFETFLAVYETKSFTRAADHLFVSQPTITVRIKKLEAELNTVLFVRGKNQEIMATEAAEIFYGRAVEYLADWDELQKTIRQSDEARRPFKIAVSHSAATSIMPLIFKTFIDDLPKLDVEITLNNSEKVFDLVSNHEIHFGIIEKPIMGDQLISIPLFRDELVLAGDQTSGIFFIRETGSGVSHYTQKYLKEQQIIPKNLIRMDNNDMILAHVKAGLGASILSKRFMTNEIPYQEIGKGFKRMFYGLAYADEQDPLIKKLIEQIRAVSEFS